MQFESNSSTGTQALRPSVCSGPRNVILLMERNHNDIRPLIHLQPRKPSSQVTTPITLYQPGKGVCDSEAAVVSSSPRGYSCSWSRGMTIP
jgi:hypothetical protein